MASAHRQDDFRICGATTVVIGQSTVFVEGKLWAVENDINTHGNGQLVSVVGNTVRINGKRVIVIGDTSLPDNLCIPAGPPHCEPFPTTGASTVNCY